MHIWGDFFLQVLRKNSEELEAKIKKWVETSNNVCRHGQWVKTSQGKSPREPLFHMHMSEIKSCLLKWKKKVTCVCWTSCAIQLNIYLKASIVMLFCIITGRNTSWINKFYKFDPYILKNPFLRDTSYAEWSHVA